MNNQRERLRKIAEILDKIQAPEFDTYIQNLYQRKLVQKKIFLLQELGLNLNYLFKWNAFGPYSEELSEDIREVLLRKKKGARYKADIKLTSGEETIVNKLSYFEKYEIRDPENRATFYEIISSIQFLSSRFPSRFAKLTDKESAIIENLLAIKPDLHDLVHIHKATIFSALKACNLMT